MPSFIDKLSNIDRYRQTITIIVSSLIVLSITSLEKALQNVIKVVILLILLNNRI
jgi:hypothetical protein